jgi:hypothetical protein
MLLWEGQFRVAPRSCLHRPFVVRLLGLRAIACVNFGLNSALLGGGTRGGFFHDFLASRFREGSELDAREGSGSKGVQLSMRHFGQRFQ